MKRFDLIYLLFILVGAGIVLSIGGTSSFLVYNTKEALFRLGVEGHGALG